MLEMGIGRAHNVHLASLPNFSLPGDVSASERYFATEIIAEPFTVQPDGTMRVPTGPGIGVTVLEKLVRKIAVQTKQYRPITAPKRARPSAGRSRAATPRSRR
jgi:O-succinylbenzoate synthase